MQNSTLNFNLIGPLVGKISNVGDVFIFLAALFYSGFSFVLVRRVKIMNDNFKTPYANFFRTGARLHFLASLLVALLALIAVTK